MKFENVAVEKCKNKKREERKYEPAGGYIV